PYYSAATTERTVNTGHNHGGEYIRVLVHYPTLFRSVRNRLPGTGGRVRPLAASITYSPDPDGRTLRKTMCRPSGAQLGSSFRPSCVICCTVLPGLAASATMI